MEFKYNRSFKEGYYKVSFKAYGDKWYWEGVAEDRREAYNKAIKVAANSWFGINEPPEPWEVSRLRIRYVPAPSYGMLEDWQFIAGVSWLIVLVMFISQFL
ncbi:hypothetical protein EFP29_91 [Enterococcus phage EF-P29]|nr:hypothetical protein EFP29_91 [Enterococcus phage EF-P29]